MNTQVEDFVLKFGKYKGGMFSQTPKSYQDWLLKQDWFKGGTKKVESNVLYNVIRKYERDYANAMGVSKQIEESNLSWEQAKIVCENLNICYINDITDYFFNESAI